MASLSGRASILLLVLCSYWTAATAREKADVLTMRNGDRLTGQIVVMQFGKLSLKTDYLGTATIEWLDIARAESPQQFIVEDLRGRYFSGSLVASGVDRRIVVRGDDGAITCIAHPSSAGTSVPTSIRPRIQTKARSTGTRSASLINGCCHGSASSRA